MVRKTKEDPKSVAVHIPLLVACKDCYSPCLELEDDPCERILCCHSPCCPLTVDAHRLPPPPDLLLSRWCLRLVSHDHPPPCGGFSAER